MLRIQFSNRIETLCRALVDSIGAVPASPFCAQQIVVPSSAMRRYLTLAIAERYRICANVECSYLAQWLWRQIAKVVPAVAAKSPYDSSALAWCIYQVINESAWDRFPRLDAYLRDPSDVLRFELCAEIAALFEQYITYRQDWMKVWMDGGVIPMAAATTQIDDQQWQAELWRRVSATLGAAPEHPALPFLRQLAGGQAGGSGPLALPETVHVFCLPDIPPLYLALLNGLASRVDVTLYVLNPCREYWFDIVDPRRLRSLTLRGAATHHLTGNRLLASWGKQTRAHVEMLLDRSNDAPLDDDGFVDNFPHTMLGSVQQSIFRLTELAPACLHACSKDRSIEVHVCHSLTRELEVLQDQLLALFAAPSAPSTDEVLIVTPDLEAAAPLIDAVFGNVPDERRVPYVISGRGRGTVNVAARALQAVLAILPSRFLASGLVELLQQPLIGRRFSIGPEELVVIEEWLHSSGIRWGINAEHRREMELPASERFTIADGLDRLFLGYALPDHVSVPAFDRIPAGKAEGDRSAILGSFAEFVGQLTSLRNDLATPRVAGEWLESLLFLLETFLAPTSAERDDLAEVRQTLRQLHGNMASGGLTIPIALPVVRAALESLFDDEIRGGLPSGSVTFASMSSLRNLPFSFIGIIGLNDGDFPAATRPREFDLIAALPRAGDRQRRLDERNVFLDLILAARKRLYLSYTGRSIRDNSVRPPSVLVAELVETLLPALAEPGNAEALARAHGQLIIEHPLQAFAPIYFRADDDRIRSYNREMCDALRHAMAAGADSRPDEAGAPATIAGGTAVSADADHDEATGGRTETRFFTTPLSAPGAEWFHVSLDQLRTFFRNPCHFLLKHRLGISLYREDDGVEDAEPFLPDTKARQALAERLLPYAMQGLDSKELQRLAQAGIEYPPDALGLAALADEMCSLQRFADEVRNAESAPRLPPLTVNLPFALDGERWKISTVLTERRETGLVLHRYDDTRAGDYLCGWLTHLVAAAASRSPIETRWISRDGDFRFTDCRNASTLLERLLMLYRRGLREPIHFFPKSAWRYITSERDVIQARAQWHPTFETFRGEDSDEAYRLALRGVGDPLDSDFRACAEAVFGSSMTYLEDRRL